jgi:membrane associated rhomboid family serine protease/Tfp pilus assembly protein PilF
VRPPPSPLRLPAYPITGGVGLLAAAVTLLIAAGKWDLARFEVNPTAFGPEPWRLVLSALPHAVAVHGLDFLHLPFNLYWLWVFGTALEDAFGHVKTGLLFVLLAAGSAAAEYALFVGGIGLSGVTYGLFGLLWFLAPRDRRLTDAVDARTTQLMVGWFFLCILLTVTNLSPIGNVAHGVGALLGVLLGVALAARTLKDRLLASFAVPFILALAWLGATVARPRVNFAHDAHGSFQLGLTAIQTGRFDDAIRHYRVAVATDPKNSAAWYNLGIAYESSRRADDAVDAYRRAYDVDPLDARHRAAYVGICRKLGVIAAGASDHARAVRLLKAATEVEPGDGYLWFTLGQSYAALGQTAEADDARDRAIKLAPPPAP